jgi:predicted ester cyclase
VTVNDQTSEGDTVVTRVTLEGTNDGSVAGMPPTGKRVSVTAIATAHFRDGKIVEAWGNLNQLLMMQQLGVIPTF